MKKLSLLWIAFLAFSAIFVSCKQESADLTVDYVGSDKGWYGDTITFKINVNATNDFSLNVSNNHDNQTFEDNYQAGSNTIDYQYIIPSDVSEGDVVSVSFSVTVKGKTEPVTVVKDITATTTGGGETVYHHGTVSEDETWLASQTHIVDGNLYVTGCKITIEPGTIIRVQEGYEIEFSGQNTELQANGTAEAPITFTSDLTTPTAGSWDGLYFSSGVNTTTLLNHCKIEYAGSNSNYGVIVLNSASISVENCEISKSGSYGVDAGSNSFVSFVNDTIKECADYAITISASAANSIGDGNVITSDMGIEITGGKISSGDVVWRKQTVPYVLTDDVEIDGANNPKLTINKGTTVLLKSGTSITVAGSEYGTLIAQGTADSMIVFSSASPTPQEGDWDYIMFDQGSTNCLLEYCDIKYGGGNSSWGMVDLEDNAVVSIKNSKLSYSKYFAVKTEGSTNGFQEFTNNELTKTSGHLMKIKGLHVGTIGDNNTFTTDANSGILVTGAFSSTITINSDCQWNKQTCPYYIGDEIIVRNNATLTITHGAVLKFMNDTYLQVGYSDEYGRLYAEGNDGAEDVIFTSASPSPQNGDWYGIIFDSNTLSGSVLDYCKVFYGGGNSSYPANVTIYPCGSNNPSLSDCEIAYSAGYGIYLKKVGGNLATPSLYNNSIHDNTSGDIGQDN